MTDGECSAPERSPESLQPGGSRPPPRRRLLCCGVRSRPARWVGLHAV